jgi:hypothetical protein
MTPTIEIKQGINCHYIETRGVNVDDVPVGRYRLIDEDKIEELWAGISVNEDWIMKAGYVHKLLTAAGLGKGETK